MLQLAIREVLDISCGSWRIIVKHSVCAERLDKTKAPRAAGHQDGASRQLCKLDPQEPCRSTPAIYQQWNGSLMLLLWQWKLESLVQSLALHMSARSRLDLRKTYNGADADTQSRCLFITQFLWNLDSQISLYGDIFCKRPIIHITLVRTVSKSVLY